MFAHGFGTDQKMWRLVAPAFEPHYRVIRFDYVGSGGADRRAQSDARYTSLAGYAQDLLEICAALELKEVVLVAHSVSGMIGMLASLEAPELFERMVLVAPSARYLNDAPNYVGGFDIEEVQGFLDMMDQNFLGWADTFSGIAEKNPETSKQLFDAISTNDPRTARRFAEVTFHADVRAELPRVSVPCLLLQCEDDAIVPLVAGEYLRDHLPGCVYHVLPVAGHCPQISAPELIISEIRDFLARPRSISPAPLP
ncbi:MAG TPA: alpha/beta hydrolase [Polyangiaceae bacterium]|nr:alpha/beta hydrolase [Polyangiaceae bacterium]